jgi:voltage-gated potassium channel
VAVPGESLGPCSSKEIGYQVSDEGNGGRGRLERPLVSFLQRKPLTARRAAGLIAVFTVIVTVLGAVTVRLVDHKDFPALGNALWWSVQTVTTVGYGDVVPHHTWGRIIGTVILVSGIAFLSVLTAAVTASLIEAARRRRPGADDVSSQLARIDERLSSIEGRLDDTHPPS